MSPRENTPDWKPPAAGAEFPPKQVDEYEIIAPLGQGAMGQVYQAVDTLLGRPVAVKFIAQESSSATARERFLVEARAIARLQHPNVVSIYRVGVVDGWPYLVSELVRGQSLDRVALPLGWPRALDIAVQLARGLAAAHSQGVLHRDLKPGKVAGDAAQGVNDPQRLARPASSQLGRGSIVLSIDAGSQFGYDKDCAEIMRHMRLMRSAARI